MNFFFSFILVVGFLFCLYRLYDNNRKALAGVSEDDPFLLSIHTKFLYIATLWALFNGAFKCVTICNQATGKVAIHAILSAFLDSLNVAIEISLWLFLVGGHMQRKITIAFSIAGVCFAGLWATYSYLAIAYSSPDPYAILLDNRVLNAISVQSGVFAFTYGLSFLVQLKKTPKDSRPNASAMDSSLSDSSVSLPPTIKQMPHLSVRKGILLYTGCLTAYYAFQGIFSLLRASHTTDIADPALCGYQVTRGFYFLVFPHLLYKVLLLDSAYWRQLVGQCVLTADQLLNAQKAKIDSSDPSSVDIYVASLFRKYLVPSNQLYYCKNIGHGSQGTVKLYIWRGTEVCVKTIFHSMLTSDYVSSFSKEAEIQRQLDHVNVVDFYGLYYDPPRIGIMIEYCCRGNLFDLLMKEKSCARNNKRGKLFTDDDVSPLQLALDIARGLRHLRDKSIVHGDLKSLNILVKKEDEERSIAKLADFGSAEKVKNLSSSAMNTQERDPLRFSDVGGRTLSTATANRSGIFDDGLNYFANNKSAYRTPGRKGHSSKTEAGAGAYAGENVRSPLLSNDHLSPRQQQPQQQQQQRQVSNAKYPSSQGNSSYFSGDSDNSNDSLLANKSRGAPKTSACFKLCSCCCPCLAKPSVNRFENRKGVLKGTVPWCSPEGLEGVDLVPASDVFSFGIVLWELVTWEQPYIPVYAPPAASTYGGGEPRSNYTTLSIGTAGSTAPTANHTGFTSIAKTGTYSSPPMSVPLREASQAGFASSADASRNTADANTAKMSLGSSIKSSYHTGGAASAAVRFNRLAQSEPNPDTVRGDVAFLADYLAWAEQLSSASSAADQAVSDDQRDSGRSSSSMMMGGGGGGVPNVDYVRSVHNRYASKMAPEQAAQEEKRMEVTSAPMSTHFFPTHPARGKEVRHVVADGTTATRNSSNSTEQKEHKQRKEQEEERGDFSKPEAGPSVWSSNINDRSVLSTATFTTFSGTYGTDGTLTEGQDVSSMVSDASPRVGDKLSAGGVGGQDIHHANNNPKGGGGQSRDKRREQRTRRRGMSSQFVKFPVDKQFMSMSVQQFSQFARDLTVAFNARPPVSQSWPPRLLSLIQGCWQSDCDMRISIDDVITELEALLEEENTYQYPLKYDPPAPPSEE
eukprot:CAMPEP_0175161222 /NCGR_PEP_ID=MMETSP0087-20121206/24482_1 /TAXON_ID=136419 /ORGANISM="Unknown Unknown, Strain D1" /LENGTH=1138 /DNA_ID=CAMNT_0016449607 /DNA_START=278 /DNA_END=3694 /DNA_ORIENTATION=+